jgi:hypothetical protein
LAKLRVSQAPIPASPALQHIHAIALMATKDPLPSVSTPAIFTKQIETIECNDIPIENN